MTPFYQDIEASSNIILNVPAFEFEFKVPLRCYFISLYRVPLGHGHGIGLMEPGSGLLLTGSCWHARCNAKAYINWADHL